jgi:hypothetical protein
MQEIIQLIALGLAAAVAIAAFVLAWRGMTLLNKQFNKMLDAHYEVIEHLEVAANPEAWVARQAEKNRRERREAEREELAASLVDDPADEPKGVF